METLSELEAFGQFLAHLLRACAGHGFLQFGNEFRKIDAGQQLLHGFSAHAEDESILAILLLCFAEFDFGQQLPLDERRLLGVDHQIIFIVNNALQLAGGHVQGQAKSAWHAFVKPNVGHGHGQFDVAHALAADPAERDFHAATVTDDALVLDAFVFSAGTFPVPGGTKNALAEQTTFFGLERAVVDRFRILDFAFGPRPDDLGVGDRDGDVVEALWSGIAAEEFAQMGFSAHGIREWESGLI